MRCWGKKIKKRQGQYSRRYVSLFGDISIVRQRYYLESGKNYHALDDHLSLPLTQLSYKLQGLIGKRSTEENYRSSVDMLNELLEMSLEATEVKRVVEQLSPLAASYYEDYPVAASAPEEGSHLCFGNDGKGVRIIKSEREDSPLDVGRLMKGQKRGVKKQATVSVSFSFNPFVRTSEDILQSLFREKVLKKVAKEDSLAGITSEKESTEDNRMSIGVHRRAFMGEQKKAIHYAIDQLMARQGAAQKDIIALVDCGTGLEKGILQAIEDKGLKTELKAIIADIVHVSEYIWKGANAVLGEKSTLRTVWVRRILKDILEGKVEQVAKDLQVLKDKGDLKESAAEQLAVTIKYLENHKHKMNYDEYLQKGYPISTGIIESTCGHLVKDRMEDSGMRWTVEGAQQMLDLRAVNKNGDWKTFMGYVQDKNKINILKLAA
jgi:hypothetical protein